MTKKAEIIRLRTEYPDMPRKELAARAGTSTGAVNYHIGKAKLFMPTDRWDLKVGSKCSKAAELFASGNGITMHDVKDKLGMTFHEMLVRLQRKGHTVIKTDTPGKRLKVRHLIKLIHKDGEGAK